MPSGHGVLMRELNRPGIGVTVLGYYHGKKRKPLNVGTIRDHWNLGDLGAWRTCI